MNRPAIHYVLLPLVLSSLSCSDSSTGVILPKDITEAISVYENVPWTLKEAFTADTVVDISQYAPFEMMLATPYIRGYDGCNRYSAVYEVHGDSMAISWAGGTELACLFPEQFEQGDLVNSWRVMVSSTALTFVSPDRYLRFESDVTLPVTHLPILSKRMILDSSNDPSFHAVDSLRLYPYFTLWNNRGYSLWWGDDCGITEDNKTISGYFGIGSDSSIAIKLYYGPTCYAPEYPYGGIGNGIRRNLPNVDKYSTTDTSLVLYRSSDGLYFKFVVVNE